MPRVQVFFTVDVEIWPGDWTDVDGRFPEAFRRYVYGPTRHGDCALPLKLRVLNDHGLHGVFFVEPIFSARFGLDALSEVVGLIERAGQEVQLHLHAEWVNEARERVLAWQPDHKIQHLSHLPRSDQSALIAWGQRRLADAGAPAPTAFRAGSFAFNRDTLRALEDNAIHVDTSYNHAFRHLANGILDGPDSAPPVLPFSIGNVLELPVTVYRDRPAHLRPLQLTACSLDELKTVLWHAAERGDPAVVIVSHNFELMNRRDFSRDETVVRRYIGLCDFLDRNRDSFVTASFRDQLPAPAAAQPAPLCGSLRGLVTRYGEQIARRLQGSTPSERHCSCHASQAADTSSRGTHHIIR